MSYVRQPLLNKEQEEHLKEDMTPLWLEGLGGREIAQQLQFGIPNTTYAKLKPHYVYFYRQRFELPIRRIPSFAKKTPYAKRHKVRKTRYKYHPEELGLLTAKEFIEEIEKIPHSIWHDRLRAYLTLHYFTPLRASEIYERVFIKDGKDFTIAKDKLTIHLLRKKKKHEKDDKDEPLDVSRELPLIDEVVKYLQEGKWKEYWKDSIHPFSFGRTTALNYVKLVFPKRYPHFFRFNWITEEADQPNATLRRLTAKTKLTISAASKYIFTDKKTEEEMDKAKVERLRDEGVL